MRIVLILVVLLAGCGRAQDPVVPQPRRPTPELSSRWHLHPGSEGAALDVDSVSGGIALRLLCPSGAGRLRVNAPGFIPIGSEDRFSFGQGNEVVALVADVSGNAADGGVTGEAPVPRDLRRLLSGPVSASYGAQVSGPHPAPPAAMVDAFVRSCLEARGSGASPAPPATAPSAATADIPSPSAPPTATVPVSACLKQDDKVIAANALRAVGTEPFWGARVRGRCVTYSHPGDPAGTRVWTRFRGSASDGTWSGELHAKPFLMRTHPEACSDGMSDTRYAITVSMTVDGQQRAGCAAAD